MARYWIGSIALLAVLVTMPACKKKTEQQTKPPAASEAPAQPAPAPDAPQT